MYRAERLRSFRSTLQRRKPVESLVGVEPEYRCDFEKLYDIHPALATFEAGDERLIFAQFGSEFRLRQACGLTLFN